MSSDKMVGAWGLVKIGLNTIDGLSLSSDFLWDIAVKSVMSIQDSGSPAGFGLAVNDTMYKISGVFVSASCVCFLNRAFSSLSDNLKG